MDGRKRTVQIKFRVTERRYHSRQLRHHAFLGRQGKNDAQRNIGDFRQGNDRQLQHFRNKGAGAFAWAELSEIGKAAYDGR